MPLKEIIDAILIREGGYVDDPDDPGGATNWGITQRTLAALRRKYPDMGLPGHPRDLTIAQARKIYEIEFVRPLRWLPLEILPVVADSAVQHGMSRAVMILQKTINDFLIANHKRADTLEIDGIAGSATKRAMRTLMLRASAKTFASSYLWRRWQFINGWLGDRAEREKFRQGMKNRLIHVADEVGVSSVYVFGPT